MKLRNKKTGETAEIILNLNEILPDAIRRTIKEAGWEEAKEQLIKDEKIRKAVRAWAEASGINQQEIKASIGTRNTEFIGWEEGETRGLEIEFRNPAGIENIADGKTYTITELCGEEEE